MDIPAIDETKCKGVVQQGPRKNLQCQREISNLGYCIYHQRNVIHDTLVSQGKMLCNGFFRGCDNELSSEDVKQSRKFCEVCRLKKSGKLYPCQANNCHSKIKKEEDKYCDKHVRNLLRDNEKEKNIQYCDIDRGCFNILSNDIKCIKCREKEKEKSEYEMSLLRKHYNINLPEINEKDILFEKQEVVAFEIKEVWRNIQRNAALKKTLFTLSQQEVEQMVIQPCYYCGFYSKYKFIGIDRIDNNKGYIPGNCIPSCKMCNMMKSTNHPNIFLDKISLICSYRQNKNQIHKKENVKWDSFLTRGDDIHYNEYRRISEQVRNIKFYLTPEQYQLLLNKECYLCGICPMNQHRNGIDRIDNTGDYTIENCRSCCGHCNMMKREYSYDDFMKKCIQIEIHKCDRTIFSHIPIIISSQKLRNEYYTTDDIVTFIKEDQLTNYLEWCEEKGKSVEFKNAIIDIASNIDDMIRDKIKKELDNERARKLIQHTNTEKKHIHCNTVYAWLKGGKVDEFIQWYTSTYEKTSLFDTRFEELKNQLYSVNKEEGIKLCKKFMYDEKSRRNTQKIRSEKCRNIIQYSPVVESQKYSDIIRTNIIIKTDIINSNDKNQTIDKVAETVIQRQQNITQTEQLQIPKQWKVNDIYNIIKSENENIYYEYVINNNEINDKELFNSRWKLCTESVKNKSKEDSMIIIKEFVVWLRTQRHNKICSVINIKRTLEKTDRQHYRTDGILSILQTNNVDEINKFKMYIETRAGLPPDDQEWVHTWDTFISIVKTELSIENKKKIISEFLLSQRKCKRRLNNASN